jgi:hypothetical protein
MKPFEEGGRWMQPRRTHALLLLTLMAMPGLADAAPPKTPPRTSAGKSSPPTRHKAESPQLRLISPSCTGEYADFLSDLLPANAAFEKGPDSTYSYCLRTTATYEHVYYGRGGKLKRTYLRAEAHGTGFAYKQKDGDFYMATNEHVAEYPEITDDEHSVDGVPAGSRKVREVVKIVTNESDDYEPGQVPLTKVLADAPLDIAIFKTRHPLKMVPYRMGHSSGLRAGNVILARGFPLGVFPASNTGKVTNPHQEDSDSRWQHMDFVTDALLNSGNSGSPVFAVSCRTGELELVGIYHAHYSGGTGLGLVVGIDQLRDVLENLRLPKKDAAAQLVTSADDRKKGMGALEQAPLFFPYADQVVRAERDAEGGVRFTLFRDFPLTENIHLAILDHDGKLTLEMPSRVPRPIAFTALDPPLREPLERLTEGLWKTLRATIDFRAADARSASSPDAAKALAEVKSRITSHIAEQKDLLSGVNFEAEDTAWPVIVDATALIEKALPPSMISAQEHPDGGPAPSVP